MLDLGVEIIVSHSINRLRPNAAEIESNLRQERELGFDSIVMVTSRIADDSLYQALLPSEDRFASLRAIGDCLAPSTVAQAVYDGHAAARYLQAGHDEYAPLFVRDLPSLD